jgi:dihydroxyacid dehydratase/phosphogluconate dehydratase
MLDPANYLGQSGVMVDRVLAESMVKPTTMLYRNFLAMETEELLRSHPVDGAVLMGGCDKTTPGLTMGALSAGLPFIYLPAGPMLRGNWKGQVLARAPTPSSTGTNAAPDGCRTRPGTRWKPASRAATAPA